jgi:outer membrane biosynthesis protein TonB
MGRDPTEGLGEAVVSGAALGGATGGAFGAAARPQRPDTPPPSPPRDEFAEYEEGDILPDRPTPEPTAYIQAQLPLIGQAGRSAVYASPGTNVGEVNPDLYDVIELDNEGTLVVAKGDTATADMVSEAVATGDDAALQNALGQVLGYGATGKYAGATEALRVVDADGNTAYDVAYDSASPEAETMVQAAQMQADALGGEVRRIDIDQAIYERDQILQEELRGVETPMPEAAPAPDAPAQADQTPEPLAEETIPETQPVAEEVPPPAEPAEVPKSPFSLEPIPDDENESFQYLAAAYNRAINSTRDLKHGTKAETLVQAADDLVTTMQGLVQDLKKERYNIPPSAMVKALGKLIARTDTKEGGGVSAKDFKEGNFKWPRDLLYKEQGSGGQAAEIAAETAAAPAEGVALEGLSPEAQAAQLAGEGVVGPGRKSGRYKGRISERIFNEAMTRVKKLLDEANAKRQGKTAAPATKKEMQARKVKTEEAKPATPTKAKQQPVVEPKPKPAKKARRAKSEPKKEVKAKIQKAKAKRDTRTPEEKMEAIIVKVQMRQLDGTMTMIETTANEELAYQEKRMEAIDQMIRCLAS